MRPPEPPARSSRRATAATPAARSGPRRRCGQRAARRKLPPPRASRCATRAGTPTRRSSHAPNSKNAVAAANPHIVPAAAPMLSNRRRTRQSRLRSVVMIGCSPVNPVPVCIAAGQPGLPSAAPIRFPCRRRSLLLLHKPRSASQSPGGAPEGKGRQERPPAVPGHGLRRAFGPGAAEVLLELLRQAGAARRFPAPRRRSPGRSASSGSAAQRRRDAPTGFRGRRRPPRRQFVLVAAQDAERVSPLRQAGRSRRGTGRDSCRAARRRSSAAAADDPPTSSTCGGSPDQSRTSSVAVTFSSVLKVSLSARRARRCEGSRPTLATSQRTRLRHSEP